ncbi:MAG: hypothetical protein ACYCO9_18775 [Streptosporangiaceae bacterium]
MTEIPVPRHVNAPLVVAAWGAANGLLTALLAGMGGYPVELAIYGVAVIVAESVAIAVLISRRRWPGGPPRRQPPGGATSVLLAVGTLVLGLGLAFGFWLSVCSAAIFVLAATSEVYQVHRRSSG